MAFFEYGIITIYLHCRLGEKDFPDLPLLLIYWNQALDFSPLSPETETNPH